MRAILVATCVYFGLVFGTGFVLGIVRVLFLLPVIGERTAELIEAPIMIAAIILAARIVIRRFLVGPTLWARVAVGVASLFLLLVVEFTFVLWLRDLTIRAYLANRDPVAGWVYVASLTIFALAPAVVGARLQPSNEGPSE